MMAWLSVLVVVGATVFGIALAVVLSGLTLDVFDGRRPR